MFPGLLLVARRADGSWINVNKRKETAEDDGPRLPLFARRADGSWMNMNKSKETTEDDVPGPKRVLDGHEQE